MRRARRGLSAVGVVAVVAGLFLTTTSANAATPAPSWHLTTNATPTVFHSAIGSSGRYVLALENVGAADSEGEITLTDELPDGVTVGHTELQPSGSCSGAVGSSGAEVLTCRIPEPVVPSGFVVLDIFFSVTGPVGPGPVIDRAAVTGGGTPSVADQTTSRIGPEGEVGPAGLERFGFQVTGPAGEPETQAGGHPHFLTTTAIFNSLWAVNDEEQVKPVEPPKDLVFYLPLGMLGNATVPEYCPPSLVETGNDQSGCPPSSRIGAIEPLILGFATANNPNDPTHVVGIYNVRPEKGYAAEFAFSYNGLIIFQYINVVRHDGQYMLRVATPGIPGVALFTGIIATFYGDIAEHYESGFEQLINDRGAFLTNPTDCGEGQAARQGEVASDSWVHPDLSLPIGATYDSFPNLEGCNQLQISAGLAVTPETTQAESPSGYEVDLTVPQGPNGATGLATPPVKDVEIQLPKGTTISPSSANGLGACQATGPEGINIEGPESELIGADGLPQPAPGKCPTSSIVGTVRVTSPLQEEELDGHLFLAAPHCGGTLPHCTNADAEDGSLFGLYLEVEGPHSEINIKIAGHAKVDPSTGQVTAIFKENPQLTFTKLATSLRGGPRAPLVTPQTCGSFGATADLTPWSAPETPDAHATASFPVGSGAGGSGCPSGEAAAPNKPSFQAGTTTTQAGAYSPFVLKLSREDGSQRISSIDTTLPPGLTGKLAGIPYCSDAAIAAASGRNGTAEQQNPSCPAASEVGTVSVGAGPGSQPLYVQGHAYLAGPYKGAPISLAIITPAVAGPFDLGTVVVRTALYVDELTTQIHAVSDPLPTILDGVPLDIRSIALQMNRPQFTLNPTSCDKMSVLGSATALTGQVASFTEPFQVGGCAGLQFAPKLAISLKGQTHRAGHPALRAVLTYPKGGAYANIARAQVSLPHSEFLDQGNLNKVCTRPELAAHACPAKSIYGHATAYTPLLEKPLEGPVYLAVGFGYKLPALVAELNGQIRVLLKGKVDTDSRHGIRNTFEAVPDAPVSKFILSMKGGKKYGLLENSEDICAKAQKAEASFTGQNGKVDSYQTTIANSCGKKSKKGSGKKKGGHP